MRGSWKIGTLAGIGIYIHWTFPLLLGWIFISHLGQENATADALRTVGFVLAIFGCVVLHELGHALAARKFHIATRDITLLPIGGVARLERMPDDPRQELWVALAGPAVNVVIALVLASILALQVGLANIVPTRWLGTSLMTNLMIVNVLLVVFNLLPAFPMDGGRVLRALLAHKMDYVRATEIAARIGQFMAVVFGFLSLLGNPLLLFIALFVYLGAQEEARMVTMRSVFAGLPVRAAMVREFNTLAPTDTLSDAIAALLRGTQQDFPVLDNGRFVGMLYRSELLKALTPGGHNAAVADVMNTQCAAVEESDMLDATFAEMQTGGCSALAVMRGEQLVGMLTLENIGELMMLHSALGSEHRPWQNAAFRQSA